MQPQWHSQNMGSTNTACSYLCTPQDNTFLAISSNRAKAPQQYFPMLLSHAALEGSNATSQTSHTHFLLSRKEASCNITTFYLHLQHMSVRFRHPQLWDLPLFVDLLIRHPLVLVWHGNRILHLPKSKKKKQVWKILSESDNLEDGSTTRWWHFWAPSVFSTVWYILMKNRNHAALADHTCIYCYGF